MEEVEQNITEVVEQTPEEKAAELEAKEAKVLELRRAGFTFQRIAEEVGYATPSGAQRALERIMTRNVPPVSYTHLTLPTKRIV